MNLNQQQILAIAPDDASAKAGSQLANPNNWVLKSAHSLALWGECQGSGKTPYRTSVDLTQIAFKCTCPSRKFPCKHGLGLLLMYEAKPTAFTAEQNLPSDVEEWISKRANIGTTLLVALEKNASNQDTAAIQKSVDENAQQKRIAAREKKILDGIEELQMWLKDVVRTGIMNVPQDPYKFVANIILRMNDAQATGLAYQLKKINRINFYAEGWQTELTKILAKTYFIAEAYKNKLQLNELQKEDLDALIGWTKNKEVVLNSESIWDEWFVLSKTIEEEEKLITETIWLYGTQHKKLAVFLNFYPIVLKNPSLLVAGSMFSGELVFYPSNAPMRALIKSQENMRTKKIEVQGIKSIEALKQNFTDFITRSPFIDDLPFILTQFFINSQNKIWFISDNAQKSVKLSNTDYECWCVLSISQGKPFNCFAVYGNDCVTIHGVWFENTYYFIKKQKQ